MQRLVLGSVLALACGGSKQATSPALSVTPASATVTVGGTQQFTVTGSCPDGSTLGPIRAGIPPFEIRGREGSSSLGASQHLSGGDVPGAGSGRPAGEEQHASPSPR